MPEYPYLLLLESKVCLRNGNIDDAIPILNILLNTKPNNSDAIVYRAIAYYEKDRINECIEDFDRVYSKSPNKKEISILIAKGYFKIGNFEKSRCLALQAL